MTIKRDGIAMLYAKTCRVICILLLMKPTFLKIARVIAPLIIAFVGLGRPMAVGQSYPTSTSTLLVTSDPSGSCSIASFLVFNTTNGGLWGCSGTPGTWQQVSAAGGGGPGYCAASNSGAPNALTCTISGFTLATGSMVNLAVTTVTTSTSVTLEINSGTAYTVLRATGNAPSAGQIAPNATPLLLAFTGTNFEIVNDSFEAGSTNCLAFTRTAYPWTIDINTSCVPQLSAVNTWTGYNNFSGAQIRLPESTVSGLPSASSNTGKEFIVTDGTSASDCSTGSGSTVVNMCRSNGTSWVFVGASGGSGGSAYQTLFGWCYGAVSNDTNGVDLIGLGGAGGNNCNGGFGSSQNNGVLVSLSLCSLKNLYVHSSASGSGSGDGVVTVYDNGSSTTLTCTLGSGATCSDTTHTPSTSAGHLINVQIDTTSTDLANITVSLGCQ